MRRVIAFCWEMLLVIPLLIVIFVEFVINSLEKIRKKLKLYQRLFEFMNTIESKILRIPNQKKLLRCL